MRVGFSRHHFDENISQAVTPLLRTDNYHSILAILLNYLIIFFITFLSVISHSWIYPIALLVIGSRQRALASILHDASHKVAARNKYLNYFLATFCSGFLIFSTYSAYRYSHLRCHHRHFGDPEKDDDFNYMLKKGVYNLSNKRGYIQRIFVYPLILLTVPSHLVMMIKSRCFNGYDKRNSIEIIFLVTYWFIFIVTILHFELFHLFLFFWLIPFFTTFQIINWFIELSEHAPLMMNDIDIQMSRNRNSHFFERIFTGIHNESYHLAHHLWPSVPFWNVKKLHYLLMQDEEYSKINKAFGGIFFSSNSADSLFKVLRKHCNQEYILREKNEVK